MQYEFKKNPRKFSVGINRDIEIKDCGKIHLLQNEQITFITDNNANYDFVRKDWGFYATPSMNGRLKNEGFKSALVKNKKNQYYIMVVEKLYLELFKKYCADERQTVVEWLDEREIE